MLLGIGESFLFGRSKQKQGLIAVVGEVVGDFAIVVQVPAFLFSTASGLYDHGFCVGVNSD